jgi:Na+/melibiose symporter-like transporter
MTDKEFKTGTFRKIVYGFGCVGDGGWYQLMSTFLLYFYVTVVGLNPWLASLAFAISFGVWLVINDLIVGGLSDRTRSKWGS